MRIIQLVSICSLLIVASCQKSETFVAHSAWPENNFHTQGLEHLKELVEKGTGKKILIDVKADGSLGVKDDHVLEQVKDAKIQFADILLGNLIEHGKIFGLPSMPRMSGSFEEAFSLYQANKTFYMKRLEPFGAKLLYAVPWPPSGLFTKTKLEKAKDLRQLKVRTYDKNSADFISWLGGKGLDLPFSELPKSLESGVIDSVLTSAITGVESEIWKYCKVFHVINYAYPLNIVVMSQKTFDNLSSADKDVVLRAAAQVEDEQWKKVKSLNEEALTTLKQHGVEVLDIPTSEIRETLDKASRKIRDSFIMGLEKGSYSLDIYQESE